MPTVLKHKELAEIAREFGTPVYIYHAEKIAEQYPHLGLTMNDVVVTVGSQEAMTAAVNFEDEPQ